MSAIFTIDQIGLPAGQPDRARQDIIPGGPPVQFSAVFPPPTHATYKWEFLTQPSGVSLTFSDPTIHNPTVNFGLNYGGYLVRLTVDEGLATEDVSVRYVGLKWPTSSLAVPALTETNQDNSQAPHTGYRGWEEKLLEYLWWVENNIGGGGGLGDLPITRTIYVDGARTDVYVPTGSFGYPFKTIANAIAYASTLPPAEYCLHVRPYVYDETNVTLPANIHIDAEMGAELAPSTPSNGLQVVPGSVTPSLEITIIRGLNIKGTGSGNWGLHVTVPGAVPAEGPFVFHADGGVGSDNDADLVLVDAGGVYFPDDGGSYGDGTNDLGIKVEPKAAGFDAEALVGAWSLSARENAFYVSGGGGVLANNTRIETSAPTATGAALYVDGSFLHGKNLGFGNDWVHIFELHNGGSVKLDSSIGNEAFVGANTTSDVFQIYGGSVSLSGGAYATSEGRGVYAMSTESPIVCQIRDMDLRADPGAMSSGYLLETGGPNYLDLHTYNSRFSGSSIDGRTYTHLAHTVGNVYLDGGTIEGGSAGGASATLLDAVSGDVWLLGGVDLVTYKSVDTSVNVQATANIHHGHCNVREGGVSIAGTEVPLTSAFANVSIGKFDSIIKVVARQSLAEVAAETGYTHGSIVVETGGIEPLIYVNHGTDLARDWRPLCDYVRIQREDLVSAPIDLSGTAPPEMGGSVLPLPFNFDSYLDSPPFTVLNPETIRVDYPGNYRLSFHLPFTGIIPGPGMGTTMGAYWEYSVDGGATWNMYTQTEAFDSVSFDGTGPSEVEGSVDMAPVEVYISSGSWLRVSAFQVVPVAAPTPLLVQYGSPYLNQAWIRVERGSVGSGGGGGAVDMLQGHGNPNVGPVAALYLGHHYQDLDVNAFYICTQVSPLVWTLASAEPQELGGNPNGLVPGVLGQMYRDTVTNVLYVCLGGTTWQVV